MRADIGRLVVGQNIVSAGAGIDQQTELRRTVARRRECRKRPWIAHRAPSRVEDLQLVSATRFQVCRVEGPEQPAGVGRTSCHLPPIDKQRRGRLVRASERCFDEKSLMADSRQHVRDIAAVPNCGVCALPADSRDAIIVASDAAPIRKSRRVCMRVV